MRRDWRSRRASRAFRRGSSRRASISSQPVSRRTASTARGRYVVDVGLERVLRVALVGNAPVEQEHVESPVDEELDGAVARAQVEDVAAADEAEDDQDGLRVPDRAAAVAPELRAAPSPDDVLRGGADLRPARSGDELDPVPRSQERALELAVESRTLFVARGRGHAGLLFVAGALRLPRAGGASDAACRSSHSSRSASPSVSASSSRSIRETCSRSRRTSVPAGRLKRWSHSSCAARTSARSDCARGFA